MRKWLAALVPWMVTTAALAQAPKAVQVEYTFLGTFKDESVRIKDECWVTPTLLTSWGYTVVDEGDKLGVSYTGRTFDLPVRRIDRKNYVSMTEAARYLGADAQWNAKGDSYVVLSQLRIVESIEEGMRIDLTLPVQPVFNKVTGPDRLVIDLRGAKVPKSGIDGLPKGWRAGQFEPATVRVVVEAPDMAVQFVPTMKPDRSFLVRFGSEPFDNEPPRDEASQGGISGQNGAPNVTVTALPKAEATLSAPNLAREGDDGATFMMPFTGKLVSSPSVKYINPTTIEISVSMAEPSHDGASQAFESKYATLAQATRDDRGNAKVTFTLTEPFAFELKSNERVITLRLFKPKEANGRLANKVIVVDAGHGGSETGTTWRKIQEKNITLSIAKKLAKYLTDEGASIVMIRDDDSTVPLLSRPETANESKADLYLSVHVNSNETAGSASGSITFYHMQDPVSMMLAECIQNEIVSVSKLPDMGVWSDSRIYRTKGFAVLRFASMPAVLIETGFLNNATDRARLLQPEFHDAVAKAIVKGVKVFLGESNGKD